MEQEIFNQMMGGGHPKRSPATRAAHYMAYHLRAGEAHVRLMRYETSIRRAYHQAVTQLRVTQNNRKRDSAAHEELCEQPELPAEPAENTTCDSNPTMTLPIPPTAVPGAESSS
jgi:hypothetical protein